MRVRCVVAGVSMNSILWGLVQGVIGVAVLWYWWHRKKAVPKDGVVTTFRPVEPPLIGSNGRDVKVTVEVRR